MKSSVGSLTHVRQRVISACKPNCSSEISLLQLWRDFRGQIAGSILMRELSSPGAWFSCCWHDDWQVHLLTQLRIDSRSYKDLRLPPLSRAMRQWAAKRRRWSHVAWSFFLTTASSIVASFFLHCSLRTHIFSIFVDGLGGRLMAGALAGWRKSRGDWEEMP